MVNTPTVYIEPRDWAKIQHYASLAVDNDNSPLEIGGYILFDEEDNKLYEAEIVKQEVGIMDFELLPEAVNYIPDRLKPLVKGWWHSHGMASVMPSRQDEETIREWGSSVPYLFTIIVNQTGGCYSRIDYFKPVRSTVIVDLKPFVMLSNKIKKACERKVSALVKYREVIPVYSPPHPHYYPVHHTNYDKHYVKHDLSLLMISRLSSEDYKSFKSFSRTQQEDIADLIINREFSFASAVEALGVNGEASDATVYSD